MEPGRDEAIEEFARLWTQYSADVFRRCLGWTSGRRELAEEASARACLVALEKYPAHRAHIAKTRGWLLQVAHNVCMDLHREERRYRGVPDADERLGGFREVLRAPTPEAELLSAELQGCLREWVAELPAALRVPVERHYFHEQTYREVACVLGIPDATLRKRMQRARAELRRRLVHYAHGRRQRPVRPSERARPAVGVTMPGGGGLERRLAVLDRYIDKHPSGWRKRFERALLLRQLGCLAAAAADLRLVVARQPRFRPASRLLANTLALLAEPALSMALCRSDADAAGCSLGDLEEA